MREKLAAVLAVVDQLALVQDSLTPTWDHRDIVGIARLRRHGCTTSNIRIM
jgi:hypothetical protein